MKLGITNKEFAEKDQEFKNACYEAKILNTTRQASKWRRKLGLAYKNRKDK